MKIWALTLCCVLSSLNVGVNSFSCAPPEFRHTSPCEVSYLKENFLLQLNKVLGTTYHRQTTKIGNKTRKNYRFQNVVKVVKLQQKFAAAAQLVRPQKIKNVVQDSKPINQNVLKT